MFNLLETSRLPAVAQIQEAFKKKHSLECEIAKMIKDFEQETGLAIDMIHYRRDITLPIKGSRYTALSILISAEELDRKEK